MDYCKDELKRHRSVLEQHLQMEAPGVRVAASHLLVKSTGRGKGPHSPIHVFFSSWEERVHPSVP